MERLEMPEQRVLVFVLERFAAPVWPAADW
jgi:hypothetical protein